MNRIYLSGNYIIAEKDGKTYEYAISKTIYTRKTTNLTDEIQLLESNVSSAASGRLIIPVLDLDAETGKWFKKNGITRYTVESLTDFYRTNTGFSPASGGNGAILGDVLTWDGIKYAPEAPARGSSLATADQVINEPNRKIYLFDNGVSKMQVLNNNGSLVSQKDGYGKTDHVLHNTGRLGTAVQYSQSVYSRAASSCGVAKYHNYLNQKIIDVRQSVGNPSFAMYKHTPMQTEVVYLDGSNGRIRVLDRYEAQGLTGITKTTLNPTSITVTGGLITAMI